MVKCSTCGFLVKQPYESFCSAYEEHIREQILCLDTLEFSGQMQFPEHYVYYCILHEEAFVKQAFRKTISVRELSPGEILSQEHSCTHYIVKVPGVPVQYYFDEHMKRRTAEMSKPIMITGSVLIGTQVGGIANKMETYIEQLQIDSYNSEEEKELKEALLRLREGIEASKELQHFEKESAATDLAMFTNLLRKQPDQQDDAAKKHFWSRLFNIISNSASLVTLATPIAKLLGLL